MSEYSLIDTVLSFVLHIDRHLFELAAEYGFWLYLILFAVVFCETGLVITPFLPGDSLLFASGVVAGTGHMHYGLCVLVLLAAAVLGDFVNYEIGRRVGPGIFQGERLFFKRTHLLQAQIFYEKHGGEAILLARFIPVLRTFAPFVAGIAEMHTGRFLLYNITGGVLWVLGLVTFGYLLGNIAVVREHFSLFVYAIIAVSLMPIVIAMVRNRRQ
ncbi:MAG: VTT domain-containing protein [Desulfovibrionaceae bacterium]|nr:VTT domain-containing protein [Desulfovibrionaceae bacterium]